MLAKLVESPNYKAIKLNYQNVSKDWSDWDKADLEKVIVFFDCYRIEELQGIAKVK